MTLPLTPETTVRDRLTTHPELFAVRDREAVIPVKSVEQFSCYGPFSGFGKRESQETPKRKLFRYVCRRQISRGGRGDNPRDSV